MFFNDTIFDHLSFLRKFFLVFAFIFPFTVLPAQKIKTPKVLQAGIAEIDITPEWPVRLAGFALRSKLEAERTAQPLRAKALAFGSNYQNSAVIITADLIGISSQITDSVKQRLSEKVKPERITISVSHTHSGPEIGTLLNILSYTSSTTPFSENLLPADQLIRINLYVEQLIDKLEEVALKAIAARALSLVSWGKGNVDFSYNRRNLTETVNHDMPMMKVTDLKNNLKAVFLSYACHAVCFGSGFNQYHGDWVGDAQTAIEVRHPGAIAMVAVGCGGDSNPKPGAFQAQQDKIELSEKYGNMIAHEVDRLLQINLQPLTSLPVIKFKKINLPFENVPSVKELAELTKDITVKGFYARLALERILRGEKLPTHVPYPVQVWQFGEKLNMVFLGGEVVADYSIRLKKELNNDRLWITAYSNDVPCYIASKRHIKMGGYEAESSMYYYNKPSKFKESVEDQIIGTVHSLLRSK